MACWGGGSIAAPPTETQAVEEMRRIKADWDRILQQGATFVGRCGNANAFDRIGISGSVVSYDVRKTDSVLNPYQGVLVIHGYSYGNSVSPQANGFTIGKAGLKQRFGESRVDLMAYGRTP
jgi:hypothetical protein